MKLSGLLALMLLVVCLEQGKEYFQNMDHKKDDMSEFCRGIRVYNALCMEQKVSLHNTNRLGPTGTFCFSMQGAQCHLLEKVSEKVWARVCTICSMICLTPLTIRRETSILGTQKLDQAPEKGKEKANAAA